MTPAVDAAGMAANAVGDRGHALDLRDISDGGLATLVDEARAALAAAWDRGEAPTRLIVDSPTYALLTDIRQAELAMGGDLVLLGLVVDAAGSEGGAERPVER